MTMAGDRRRGEGRGLEGSTEQVVGFVRNLIDSGRLRPGDRLPAERGLAVRIGVSPSVRAGLHTEAAGLAAERATSEHLATLAEEVAGLFANRDNPHLHLLQASRYQAREPASADPLVSAKRRAPKATRKRTTA